MREPFSMHGSFFGVILFVKWEFPEGSLATALFQFENNQDNHTESQKIRGVAYQEDGDVNDTVAQAFQRIREGGLDPLKEGGFFHRGVFLDLADVQIDGSIIDLVIIQSQLGCIVFQFIAHIGQPGFDLQKIGHIVGFCQKLQQPGFFCFQSGDFSLRVCHYLLSDYSL